MRPNPSGDDLEAWAHRHGCASRRDRIGIPEAVIEMSAPSPYLDYITWYTQEYFDHRRSPVKARLFVHDLPLDRMPALARPRSVSPLRRVALPASLEAACFVDDGRRAVHLLPRDDSRPLPRLLATRVLRALVMHELLLQGALFFHAACFTLRGTGIALLGARTAGKTTMLLHALTRPEASLVSNDKIALLPRTPQGPAAALGFPLRAGIRPGSVHSLPDGPLRTFLSRTWSKEYGNTTSPSGDDVRIQVRPQELAAAAGGSGVSPRCRLDAAIETRLDQHADKPRLKLLNAVESGALWARQHLHNPAAIFPQQAAVATPGSLSILQVPQIPTYRLTQPPSAGPASLQLIEDLMCRTAAGE
ncbi:hypothetical protein [Streptomyces sp. NPDC056949]|uniref:hypothetical protein n=1 Tax=Streptomyces sp. NPDC056949 TaxID=3345976 RepID=UPI0036320751